MNSGDHLKPADFLTDTTANLTILFKEEDLDSLSAVEARNLSEARAAAAQALAGMLVDQTELEAGVSLSSRMPGVFRDFHGELEQDQTAGTLYRYFSVLRAVPSESEIDIPQDFLDFLTELSDEDDDPLVNFYLDLIRFGRSGIDEIAPEDQLPDTLTGRIKQASLEGERMLVEQFQAEVREVWSEDMKSLFTQELQEDTNALRKLAETTDSDKIRLVATYIHDFVVLRQLGESELAYVLNFLRNSSEELLTDEARAQALNLYRHRVVLALESMSIAELEQRIDSGDLGADFKAVAVEIINAKTAGLKKR